MIYKQKFYYLTKTPLSAEGPADVEVIRRAEDTEEFPELFQEYEQLRSHAFNEDNLYSIVRADDIYDLFLTGSDTEAQEIVFENASRESITDHQNRVMPTNDKDENANLKEEQQIHGYDRHIQRIS